MLKQIENGLGDNTFRKRIGSIVSNSVHYLITGHFRTISSAQLCFHIRFSIYETILKRK